jgi:hypothetical protein
MRVPEAARAALADATAGFSFAYVKELFVSSIVRWMAEREAGAMVRFLDEQLVLLRAHMRSDSAKAVHDA